MCGLLHAYVCFSSSIESITPSITRSCMPHLHGLIFLMHPPPPSCRLSRLFSPAATCIACLIDI